MRKIFFILLLVPAALMAQNIRFGYFSAKRVMDSIPAYAIAQDEYASILERCDNEVTRGEQELTRTYVAFLDGQSTFPEPILRKRQKELQDLVDRSVVLRDQLKEWLAQAHDSLFLPLEQQVDRAVKAVCLAGDLAYAIDTDKESYRYINPAYGVDITVLVIEEILNPAPVADEAAEPQATEPADTIEAQQLVPAEPVTSQESEQQAVEATEEIIVE